MQKDKHAAVNLGCNAGKAGKQFLGSLKPLSACGKTFGETMKFLNSIVFGGRD